MPETDSSSLPARPPALGGGPPIVEPPVPIDEIAVGQSRINFSWLLKIRWAAVAGQLCTVLVVSLYLGVELPLVWLFSIISFAALTNAVLVLWFRRQLSSGRWQHRARRSPLIIGWIMVLDILLLTALLYVSGGRVTRSIITAYVEFIRNVPLILLVYLVFYGLPTAIDLAYDATTSFIATLSLYAGAHMVEVFRSGLLAVPRGLIDAGMAIGLTPWQRLVYVRLPTMFRITLPALSNSFVSLFKDTSVASVIAVPELTYGAQWINTNTFRMVEVYSVITPMYLLTGWLILYLLRLLERRFAVR